MKNRTKALIYFVLFNLVILASCKEDIVRPDPLALPEDMSMELYIRNDFYAPLKYDNYITYTNRQDTIKGRYFVLSCLLANNEKFEISVTNWFYQGGHSQGVFVKSYIFGPNDTTETCQSIGHPDSSYCDGAMLRYIISEDYIYESNDGANGDVKITRCDPINGKMSGSFRAMMVAKSPYQDTIFVQGSFKNQQYFYRTNPNL